MTRVLVCGGRNFYDHEKLNFILDELNIEYNFTLLIQGGARGADYLSKRWAINNNIENIQFDADWNTYKKSAGFIRNQKMINEGKPDLVISFPGGKGTQDMVRRSKISKIKVIEITP